MNKRIGNTKRKELQFIYKKSEEIILELYHRTKTDNSCWILKDCMKQHRQDILVIYNKIKEEVIY